MALPLPSTLPCTLDDVQRLGTGLNNHTTVVANLLRKWVDKCVPVKTI